MDRLVDLEMEADFVGKEALKKIKKEGIKRKLVGIEILGDPISKVVPPQYTPGYFVPDHWPIFDDKKEIGYVTSKCYSPRLKKNIGYAFIPIDYAKNDTEMEKEVRIYMKKSWLLVSNIRLLQLVHHKLEE